MIRLMRQDPPAGTVTFLFADVEGSTKLLEQIGDEAPEVAAGEEMPATNSFAGAPLD